jgi:hypothetical protein
MSEDEILGSVEGKRKVCDTLPSHASVRITGLTFSQALPDSLSNVLKLDR